jgi:hypothetical protein
MNNKTKHLIIFLASFLLLLSTLFLMEKVSAKEQFGNVQFGYPFRFISEDFSVLTKGFYFLPAYERFQFQKQYPITHFSVVNFLASFLVIFVSFELLVYLLEAIKFWLQSKFGKKVEFDEEEEDNA